MVIFVQNDPCVPAGHYACHLAAIGVPYSVVRGDECGTLPSVTSARAVIILGGAMGVHDEDRHPFLRSVKGLVGQCLSGNVPLLGICLGGQLLAELLGGNVSSGQCCEKGTLPVHLTPEGRKDPLFAEVSDPFTSFQWHNDCFDLPPGAVHLASSPVCRYQAFRYGTAWGLQFHPEVNAEIITDWCREIPGDPSLSGEEADRLLGDFTASAERYMAASCRILENFLKVAGINCRN